MAGCKLKYTVVYIQPTWTETGYCRDQNEVDASRGDDKPLPLVDEASSKHSQKVAAEEGVLTIQQLLAQHPGLSYNKLQLMLHANCEHFISVQGGNSYIASYFGGTNIIMHRQGMFILHTSPL